MNDNFAIIRELQAKCKNLTDRNQKLEIDRKKAVEVLEMTDLSQPSGKEVNQALAILK